MAHAARVQVDNRRNGAGRGRHVLIPHTADAGFTATAANLPTLFVEAGTALTEIGADVDPGAKATVWAEIALEAADLVSLAFGWLNELITLSDIHHGAVLAIRIDELSGPGAGDVRPGWHIRGQVGLRPYSESGVRARRQPKSATYHQLAVERKGADWTMRAYLDL